MNPINILDKAALYFAPKVAEARIRARLRTESMLAQAGYESAGSGRRWMRTRQSSQNAENRRHLAAMRNNSRHLERNNPYVGIAVDIIQSYGVGTGIRPKAKHPTSKEKAKRAQDLMDEWSHSNDCDYRGQVNLFGLQSLSMRTIPLSGESLFVKRLHKTGLKQRGAMAVPLRLELLEGDYIDEMRDHTVLPGTSGLVQGVRIEGGRPTEYYLHPHHPGDFGVSLSGSQPVDARSIAHGFDLLRPGQVRGIPWGYPVFTKIKGIDDFQDARIEQQRMAACLMGSVWSEDDDVKGDPLPEQLEPGLIARLSGQERMDFNTPPSVSGQDQFLKGEERLIASAYGVTYEELTGDYSAANFANGKMARLKMFAKIEGWQQNILIAQQLKKIEAWWLEAALLVGHRVEGCYFEWTKPRKDVLDIKNELPAIVQTVRSGLNSLQGELRSRGYDVEKVLREIAEDSKLMDELGIILDTDPRNTNKSGQLQTLSESKEETPENEADNNDEADNNQEDET